MQASAAELDDLRRSVRELAKGSASVSAVRRVVDDEADYDQQAWHAMTLSMGLAAIGVPAQYGGAGYSFTELGVVLEELGGMLAPAPFLSSAVIAPAALLGCGSEEARTRLLAGIADGSTIATVAFGDLSSWPLPERSAVTAARTGDEYRLAGRAGRVLDAGAAGLLLVVATLGDGWGLVGVDPAAPGVACRRLSALDLTRRAYEVDFTAAPGTLLGHGPADWPGLRDLIGKQSAALACEQVGGTARCLDMIIDYIKTRTQFGRPIGGFQAIKHRCADLLVELEAARSVAYQARDLAATSGPGLLAAAAAAGSWCADAYVHAAQEAIQLHGAIGFTWEHDAHLHLRRARTGQLLFGTPRAHRRALADAMGI